MTPITTERVQRMRNYLDTANKSGVKLLHLTTDELGGLLDALATKDKQIAELAADGREMRQRIAELESQRQMAFMACNRWADKFRGAESRLEAWSELPVSFMGENYLVGGAGGGCPPDSLSL